MIRYLNSLIRILIICIICLSPLSLFAGMQIDRRVDMLILQGIEAVNREEIDKSIEIFERIIAMDKENPIGYFYMAALYQVLMQNYRTLNYNDKFYFYINKAIEKGEEQIKRDKDNATVYFYLGGAYGYRAINKSEEGNWFGAFVDAVKGAENLEKAIAIDPKLYDAYYGFGVYRYWRSVKSKVLWFLPFFADEREQGIKEIRLAIERGRYSNTQAKGALITIYRNEREYAYALALTNEILEKYPESIYALRSKGIIYVEMKKWDKAAQVFNQLSERLKKRGWKEPGAAMEIEYYLTLIHQKQKSKDGYNRGCGRLAQIKKNLEKRRNSEAVKELIHKSDVLCKTVPVEEPES